MILPHGTVVAVADGTTLKLFRNRGTEPELDLVEFDHSAIVPVNPGSGSVIAVTRPIQIPTARRRMALRRQAPTC